MNSVSEDALLVVRSQEGDRAAFDDLIRRHERRAYQYAFRLTASSDEAADIVADAFVRIYHSLKNFKGSSAFTTWLYRIITNCYLDLRKRERIRRHESLDAMADSQGGMERLSEDPSSGPDELFERGERESAMQRALAKLQPYQQSMLVMYHVEALSYEEISEALDLPLGTVKSRLNRARLSLREHLAADAELFGQVESRTS